MTPDLAALLSSAPFYSVLVVVSVLAWKALNSTGSFTWSIRTTEPEHSRLRVERDEARREAERARAELEGRNG